MKLLLEYLNTAKRIDIEIINLEEFKEIIKQELDLDSDHFKLQIYDKDFNAFCDLNSINEIVNFSRLKIIENDENITNKIHLPSENHFSANLRTEIWDQKKFDIALTEFSLLSQQELKNASELFDTKQVLHVPSYKLKVEVNDILSKKIIKYGMYPTDTMYSEICGQFVQEFPFLKEPIGSGYAGWKISLKYRIQEIRRKCKSNETLINSGKRGALTPSREVKKAKNGELNFMPDFPNGENQGTLEDYKQKLILEFRKKEPNKNFVQKTMTLTFALRRKEIIESPKSISSLKTEWPFIFEEEEMERELVRIIGFDVEENLLKNIKNVALERLLEKRLKKRFSSEEEILKALPSYFKDKWSYFVTPKEDQETQLHLDTESEEIEAENETLLSPSAVIVPSSTYGSWAIMAENELLLDNLSFLKATKLLLSVYYIFNLCYPEGGQKSMRFIQEGLCAIPSNLKLPIPVMKIINQMKMGK